MIELNRVDSFDCDHQKEPACYGEDYIYECLFEVCGICKTERQININEIMNNNSSLTLTSVMTAKNLIKSQGFKGNQFVCFIHPLLLFGMSCKKIHKGQGRIRKRRLKRTFNRIKISDTEFSS